MDEESLKQSNGSHGGNVSAWSSGGSLPVLLETLYPKHLSQNLSGICTLHLRHSLYRRHLCDIAFTSVPSVTPCVYYISLFIYHPYSRRTTKMTSEKTIQYLQKINHRITCILNKNDVPLRADSTGNIKDTFLYRKAMILKGILGNTFLNKFP